MFAKFVVIVLVATSFAQARAGTEYVRYSSGPKVTGVVDDAKEFLQKLVDKVQTSIKEAVENLNYIAQDLAIYAQEITEQQIVKVQEESRKFVEQLNQIKNDAVEAGVDISECLNGKESELADLPVNSTKNIVKCGSDKVEEAKKIVADSVKAIQDTIEDTNEDKKELDECGSGIEALACVARVMGKMTLQMANIPVKIATQVAKATKLVATTHSAMAKCAVENAVQVAVEGGKIMEDITKCANEKVHPSTVNPTNAY